MERRKMANLDDMISSHILPVDPSSLYHLPTLPTLPYHYLTSLDAVSPNLGTKLLVLFAPPNFGKPFSPS